MSALAYLNFDLLLDRIGNKHKARVLDSLGGNAAHEFDAPFSADELRAFWSQLESCLQKQSDACKSLLQKFGEQLFTAVFAGQVRSVLNASLHEANRAGKGLRLRLRLTDAPGLAALPWEFLCDPANHRFLSLSNQTPIVRYLDLPERIKPLAVQPPLHMLVVIASPYDLPPLEAEQEWENLNSALAEAEQRGLVQLERLESATLSALQKRLREKPFHLFHFIGHGDFDEAAQTGVLYFENEDRKKRAVRADELGILLRDEETLRVAVLNSCRGSRSSGRDLFSGMAQRLVQQGIPAVIAMQAPLSDTAALTLSREFYSALAFGYPVDAALAEGRKALFAQGNEVEWATPVLFMRAEEGVIFDVSVMNSNDRESNMLHDPKKLRVGEGFNDLSSTPASAPQPENEISALNQSVQNSSGQVIQAGGNVIINQAGGQASEKEGLGKKLTTWLGVILTTVTIIATIIGLIQREEESAPQAARFYGLVKYADTGEPVPDAVIRVLPSEQSAETLGTGTSASNGEFNFVVKTAPETAVWVTVSKAGRIGFANMQIIATNTILTFRRTE